MNKVYLGLGSNVGNKIKNIKQAIGFFNWDTRFIDLHASSLYVTKPYGSIEQDNFINAVISFSTNIDHDNLFKITKELEKRIGRIKRESWGPREIDIDFLLFNQIVVRKEHITIPHEDLLNRDFVLVPLLELDPEIIDPVSQKKIKSFLSDLNDKYIIDKINFNLTDLSSSEKL